MCLGMTKMSNQPTLSIDNEILISSLKGDNLIPIIGNTIRNHHIFDINFDKRKGISHTYLRNWSGGVKLSNGKKVKYVKDEGVLKAIAFGRDLAQTCGEMPAADDGDTPLLNDLNAFWEGWRNAQTKLSGPNSQDTFIAYRYGWFDVIKQFREEKTKRAWPSISEELAQAWARKVNYPLKEHRTDRECGPIYLASNQFSR